MVIQRPNSPDSAVTSIDIYHVSPERTNSVHALPFFLPYIVPLFTVLAHYSSKPWHALVPPLFVWVFIPLLDAIVGSTNNHPHPRLSQQRRKRLESCLSFKLAIYLWCPVHFASLTWAANRIYQTDDSLTSYRILGLLWSVGLIAAEGINCSHELMHRRSYWERLLGKYLLVSVLYGHFTIEHSRGHHKKVATPDDPATLRYGESFYHFLPRTVIGGFRSAWLLERDHLKRNGQPIFSIHNEMIQYLLAQTAMMTFFAIAFGIRGFVLFLFQSCFAIVLLEQINAIEHYGLQRKRLPSGEFEQVGPRHSWDAPQRISNYLLFKLQVHADHHLRKLSAPVSLMQGILDNSREPMSLPASSIHIFPNTDPVRRYQALELTEGSPQLPAGYLTLAPLLFVPPLWRAVMDPVLALHSKQWEAADKRDNNVT